MASGRKCRAWQRASPRADGRLPLDADQTARVHFMMQMPWRVSNRSLFALAVVLFRCFSGLHSLLERVFENATPVHRRGYLGVARIYEEPLSWEIRRLERAIGVIYRPETERASHYFRASLPQQFDEYIWFDHTRAVAPLETAMIKGLPDTYPFGL